MICVSVVVNMVLSLLDNSAAWEKIEVTRVDQWYIISLSSSFNFKLQMA